MADWQPKPGDTVAVPAQRRWDLIGRAVVEADRVLAAWDAVRGEERA